jgi:hypothetical protein
MYEMGNPNRYLPRGESSCKKSERERKRSVSTEINAKHCCKKKVDETDRRAAARWRKRGSPWCEAGTETVVLVVLPAPRVWQRVRLASLLPSLMSFEYLLGWTGKGLLGFWPCLTAVVEPLIYQGTAVHRHRRMTIPCKQPRGGGTPRRRRCRRRRRGCRACGSERPAASHPSTSPTPSWPLRFPPPSSPPSFHAPSQGRDSAFYYQRNSKNRTKIRLQYWVTSLSDWVFVFVKLRAC